jgi:hypothetical protein
VFQAAHLSRFGRVSGIVAHVFELAASRRSTGPRRFATLAKVVGKAYTQRHSGINRLAGLLAAIGLLLSFELRLRLRPKEGRPSVLQLS